GAKRTPFEHHHEHPAEQHHADDLVPLELGEGQRRRERGEERDFEDQARRASLRHRDAAYSLSSCASVGADAWVAAGASGAGLSELGRRPSPLEWAASMIAVATSPAASAPSPAAVRSFSAPSWARATIVVAWERAQSSVCSTSAPAAFVSSVAWCRACSRRRLPLASASRMAAVASRSPAFRISVTSDFALLSSSVTSRSFVARLRSSSISAA